MNFHHCEIDDKDHRVHDDGVPPLRSQWSSPSPLSSAALAVSHSQNRIPPGRPAFNQIAVFIFSDYRTHISSPLKDRRTWFSFEKGSSVVVVIFGGASDPSGS